jgi:hypothetical protein
VAAAMPELTDSLQARIGNVAVRSPTPAGCSSSAGSGIRDRAGDRPQAARDSAGSRPKPLTATDLAHGPVAALDSLCPSGRSRPRTRTCLPSSKPSSARTSRRDDRRVRVGGRVRPARPVRPGDAEDLVAAPRTVPLDRPGAAFCVGARPCARPRSRRAAWLSKVTLAR